MTPTFTCGDPVAVDSYGVTGRVSGRTIWTPSHEPTIDVLDERYKVHKYIPNRLARLISESECPVPPFSRRAA